MLVLVLVAAPLQQVIPAAVPQTAQLPDEHLVLGAVHSVPVDTLVLVLVEQQGLPGPPQLVVVPTLQVPLLQVPGTGRQLLPLATHTLFTQQPLL